MVAFFDPNNSINNRLFTVYKLNDTSYTDEIYRIVLFDKFVKYKSIIMTIKKLLIGVIAFILMGFTFDQKHHKTQKVKDGYITFELNGETKSIQAVVEFSEFRGDLYQISVYTVDNNNLSFTLVLDKEQKKTFDVSYNMYNTNDPKKMTDITYKASDGAYYMNNKNSEGQIEITKNDGNYISGKFDMTLFNQRNTKQVHLENGTFTKLKIK